MKLSMMYLNELYQRLERCREGSRRWHQTQREITKRWTRHDLPERQYEWWRSEDPSGGE